LPSRAFPLQACPPLFAHLLFPVNFPTRPLTLLSPAPTFPHPLFRLSRLPLILISSTMSTSSCTRRLHSIFAICSLLVAVASAQTAGRFPCGTNAPNQQLCDLLNHPTSARRSGTPLNSQCVQAEGSGWFCGWQGAPYALSLCLPHPSPPLRRLVWTKKDATCSRNLFLTLPVVLTMQLSSRFSLRLWTV
jgi:hypothetical protein